MGCCNHDTTKQNTGTESPAVTHKATVKQYAVSVFLYSPPELYDHSYTLPRGLTSPSVDSHRFEMCEVCSPSKGHKGSSPNDYPHTPEHS